MSECTADVKMTETAVSKLIARLWADAGFRQRFASDPASVAQEAGTTLDDLLRIVHKQDASETAYSLSPPSLLDEQVNAWTDLDGPFALSCVSCRGGSCC